MKETKELSQEESLKLITEMIQKAKSSQFNENGTSAILWGSVVGFCGLTSFAQRYWHFSIGFDVWLLALFAIVPQIFIGVTEGRKRIVKTDIEKGLDAVWLVYGISIFALVAYLNIIPSATESILKAENIELLQKNTLTNIIEKRAPITYSFSSLMMIIYAFPTLVTGLIKQFKPMIFGAIFCYACFIISLYTTATYDNLMTGLVGIGNWLIPGLILRNMHFKAKQ